MATYLYIVQILLGIALIVLVLLQTKGSGLSGVFGQDTAVYHTRRGLEKTLFNATIAVSVAFFLVSLLTVIISG
ncbi:MAG: preprotein translocase subunit SecG [Chloroflexi bacterium]|nr:preprotein translocase subunit SecG [Chloroflexota bacterium]